MCVWECESEMGSCSFIVRQRVSTDVICQQYCYHKGKMLIHNCVRFQACTRVSQQFIVLRVLTFCRIRNWCQHFGSMCYLIFRVSEFRRWCMLALNTSGNKQKVLAVRRSRVQNETPRPMALIKRSFLLWDSLVPSRLLKKKKKDGPPHPPLSPAF